MCLGERSVKNRDKTLIGMELDIYIPELSVAFEPGSWAWHRNKIERDTLKRKLCKEKNVNLLQYTQITKIKSLRLTRIVL